MQSVAANNPTDFIFTFSYVYIFARMNLRLVFVSTLSAIARSNLRGLARRWYLPTDGTLFSWCVYGSAPLLVDSRGRCACPVAVLFPAPVHFLRLALAVRLADCCARSLLQLREHATKFTSFLSHRLRVPFLLLGMLPMRVGRGGHPPQRQARRRPQLSRMLSGAEYRRQTTARFAQ